MNQTGNLIGLAAIPRVERIARQNAAGTCITNIDGDCISGGMLIAGTSGYDVASMQPPGVAKCAAFPLFCAVQLPYTSTQPGYQCATNAIRLNSEIHQW
jgi:hypothetical protein